MMIFTGRNEVVAKVMFLHVSVILLTGGVGSPENLPRDQAEPPPHQADTTIPPGTKENPPRTRQTPPPTPPGTKENPPTRQTPPRDQGEPPFPPRTRQTPPPSPPDQGEPPRDQADPPPGRTLQHTVNERPVRILLECILVLN